MRKDGISKKKRLLAEVKDLSKRIDEMEKPRIEHKTVEEALKDSEECLKILFEFAPGAYYLNDLESNFIDGNKAAEMMTGYKREALIGKNLIELKLLPPDQVPRVKALLAKSALGLPTGSDEFTIIRKDGKRIPVEIRTYPVKIKGQTLVLGIARDISDRKRVEEALREEKDRAQKYLDIAGVMIVAINAKGEITLINRKGCEVLGYKREALIGKNWFDTCIPLPVREDVKSVFKRLMKGEVEPVEYFENPVLTKKKKERIIAWYNTVLTDDKGNLTGTLSSGEDITERKKAEERLKASLEEKEVMLREIHHRVKNNMQIIISLLRLQSRQLKNEGRKEIFKASLDRITSMSLIHENLYKSKDLARIDFSSYIRRLTTHVFSIYAPATARISLAIEMGKIFLDINKAIPCGLIINELVTNSIKHAFPGEREGEIIIKMNTDKKGIFKLTVSDNGIGFPAQLDFHEASTLGLQLVRDLVHQIDGKIRIDRSGGTKFEIKF